MSWTYAQTGTLYRDGIKFAQDADVYAGNGNGRNNPAMQNVKNVGPLPCGKYKIGKPYVHPHLGQVTMDLTPDPSNEMFGRDLFRIHGISAAHPLGSSDGCICAPYGVRIFIADHLNDLGGNDLEVVAEYTPHQESL